MTTNKMTSLLSPRGSKEETIRQRQPFGSVRLDFVVYRASALVKEAAFLRVAAERGAGFRLALRRGDYSSDYLSVSIYLVLSSSFL